MKEDKRIWKNKSVLTGGGELGQLIRNHHWSETAMGAIEEWPAEFRENLQNMLNAYEQNKKDSPEVNHTHSQETNLKAIEERFQLIARATNDTIWDWDLTSNQVWWNDSVYDMFGYETEAIGKSAEWWIANIHPEERVKVIEGIYQVIESGGKSWSCQYRFKCANDSYAQILDRGYIIHDDYGKAIRMVGSMLDLTEQKKAEKQLRDTLESIGDGFFACDENWHFSYVNARAEKLLGIKREEVIGKNHWEVFPMTLGTAIEREYKLAAAGEVRDWENYYEPWDKWFHNRCFPREGGGITVYFREITGQKKAAEALRLSAERFETITSSNIIGVVIGNYEGDVAFANDYFLNIIGYSRAELENKQIKWTEITPPEFLHLDYNAHKELKQFGNSSIYEKQYIHKDGSRRWVSITNASLSDPQGNILALILDITQRKEAEKALQKSSEKLQKTIDSITDGLVTIDRSWNIIEFSNTGAKLIEMNRQDLIGKNLWKLFPKGRNTKFEVEYSRALETGKPVHFEEFYPDPLNQWLEVNCYPDEEGLTIYFNDITTRKVAEEKIQASEAKLQSMFRDAPALIAVHEGPEHHYVFSNSLHDKIVGNRPLIGIKLAEAMPELKGQGIFERFDRVYQSGKPVITEELPAILQPDPDLPAVKRYFRQVLQPWFKDDGSVAGVMSFAYDITELLQAKEDSRKSESNLKRAHDLIQSITHGTGDLIAAEDTNCNYLFFNDAYFNEFKKLWGQEIKVGTNMVEAMAPWPEEQQKAKELWHRALKGETFSITMEFGPSDEEKHFYDLRFNPLFDSSGNIIGAAHIFRDVTDQIKAQQELKNNQSRLQAAINGGRIATWILDITTNQVVADPSIIKFFNLEDNEVNMPATVYIDSLHPDDRPAVAKSLENAIATGQDYEAEYRIMNFDPPRWAYARARVEYDENDEPARLAGVVIDISDRKKVEREREELLLKLQNQQKRLDAILHQLPAGVMIAEAESGKITYANEYALEMFGQGYPREGFAKYVDNWQPYHPDGRLFQLEEIPMYRALQGLETEDVEMYFRLKDQTDWVYTNVNGVPVKDSEGNVLEGVVSILDLTVRKELEDRLRENEVRFRTMANNISQLAWMTDETGYIFWYNKRWFDYTGTNLEEMRGWGWTKVQHPDHVDRVVEKVSKAFENGEVWEDTFPLRHKNGDYRWFLSRAIPIRNQKGKILHWFGTNTDITELRQAQETLRYQKSLLEAQQEVSPLGVLVVSPQGKILTCNNRFAEMWHVSDEILDTKKDDVLLRAVKDQVKDVDAFIRKITECYSGQKKNHDKIYFKDGRIYERYGSPIVDEAGSYYGYVWFFMDITEREYLARQKDDFLGIASHELKTPVAVMKGYVNMIEEMLKNKKEGLELPLVKKVDQQINRLTNLINELLDVTKIESGKLRFEQEAYDFDDLVAEITESMQKISKHHLKIKGRTNQTVVGDKDRTGQVIINFISNAIKYSAGTTEIDIILSATEEEVILQVKDWGMGIAESDLDRIFDRFYRVRETSGKRSSGLGLGLYICAEIINRQGGKIWAESEPGKGSVFSFALPLK